MTRGQRLAAVAVVLAIAACLFLMRHMGAQSDAELARIGAIIAEAEEVMVASRQENLVHLASDEFDAAAEKITEARGLLDDGDPAIAGPAAMTALRAVQSAREQATMRAPVQRAAVLRRVSKKVLYRAAEGVAWGDAHENMHLFNRDRVATKDGAEAVVVFREGSELKVEENSVLVVEAMTESQAESVLSMTLSVAEGGVRLRLRRDADQNVRLRLNLPQASIVIDTADGAGEADVAARVDPNRSSQIAVYTGAAEVVAPSGERVVLKSNEFAEVQPDGGLGDVREIPTAAITLLPGRDATVYISSQRPEVTFKWKRVDACASYRLELARDMDFMDDVLDELVARDRFTYGDLPPGQYLWRMSCLDEAGVQGQYSDVTHFDVVQDDKAPQLEVISPSDNQVVKGSTLSARCRTEEGAEVFINGEEASASKGEFTRLVQLSLGVNTLVFEAIDEAGNVMYNSRLVTRMD